MPDLMEKLSKIDIEAWLSNRRNFAGLLWALIMPVSMSTLIILVGMPHIGSDNYGFAVFMAFWVFLTCVYFILMLSLAAMFLFLISQITSFVTPESIDHFRVVVDKHIMLIIVISTGTIITLLAITPIIFGL